MFENLFTINATDYYALREEYANEDENYLRYMLANAGSEDSDSKKIA